MSKVIKSFLKITSAMSFSFVFNIFYEYWPLSDCLKTAWPF